MIRAASRRSLWLLAIMFLSACDETETMVYTYSVASTEWTETDQDLVAVIPVQRIGNTGQAHSVAFQTLPNSARADEDFIAVSGTLEFSPGAKSADIRLTIKGDDYFELKEDFQLYLLDDKRAVTVVVTIDNDDDMGEIGQDEDGFLTPETMPSMESVWQEEFNGNNLDAAIWNVETGNGCAQGICGWGNDELQSYSAESPQLQVDNGRLVITATRFGDSYTSARIQTRGKKEITFGRIDIRARLPKGKGIWPALWMLGSSIASKPWPACGEIDIMESIGSQPSVVHGTVHYDNNGYVTSTGSTSLASGNFSESFHVFSLVWQRNELVWYVDQKPFKSFVNNKIAGWPFNDPFYFVLNVAVGGRWPGDPDATTVFPQRMEVDYIRVFR